MDFSPSEIDALESIPPPTPLPTLIFGPPSNEPDPIFGTVLLEQRKQRYPNQPASAQPIEDPQRNDKNRGDETEAVDGRDRSQSQISNGSAAPVGQQSGTSSAVRRDQRKSLESVRRKSTRFMLVESLPQAQSPLPTAPQTRSLRKRKRDEESNIPTHESSPPRLNMRPESRRQKRPRTTRSAGQFPQQPARNLAPNGPIVHSQSQTKESRRYTTSKQLLSKPRRSARIAQLQKAKENPGQRTRRRKDNAVPGATEPNKRLRSKRPNTLGPADSRHTRKGQNGAERRTRAGRRSRLS